MSQTGLFRGEGGSVFEMDLPLSPGMEEQVSKGQLIRLDPTEPAGELEEPVSTDGDPEDDDDQVEDEQPPELAAFLDTPPEPVKAKSAKATKPKAE